jgi:hypothetical protein
MSEGQPEERLWWRQWPWALLVLIGALASWYVLDFEDDVDGEYPAVARPTFNRRPSPAYRLAEPGDTLDRVGLYLTSGAIVVSLVGGARARRAGGPGRVWIGALAISAVTFWYSATPGPTLDGWHGLGWRTIADPTAPPPLRIALCISLFTFVLAAVWSVRGQPLLQYIRERQLGGLLTGAVLLAVARQLELPGVEPSGFWPRWAWVGATTLWAIAVCRAARGEAASPRRRMRGALVFAAGSLAWLWLVWLGVDLFWYHRPLDRLKPVVPGRIYISAMPTYRGLELAHARHHFKTIVNLFPESVLGRSPLSAEEVRFAREHGICYYESPGGVADADAFLDQTLRLAQDPNAWPLLLHCHGCMDRSPAWMGIYRFVVQRRPLDEIFREIEAHRGYRPKASVALLYNRVLPPRAPDHYAGDPTAARLLRCAHGTRDPYEESLAKEVAAAAKLSGPDARK